MKWMLYENGDTEMNIPDEVVEKLTQLRLLDDDRHTNVPITQLKTLKSVEKSINSRKWENYCLDKRGDFTAYLFQNEKDLYREWNNITNDARIWILPEVRRQLQLLVSSDKLLETMLGQILFDIVGLSVYLTLTRMRPQISSEYFDTIWELYSSGYIPCGFAWGKYKVL